MCGISAIFSYHYAALPVDREEIFKINNYMKNRGPDAQGAWFSENNRVGLAHRRLSIIDLSEEANQPMVKEGVVITFNGEIYNYLFLKSELEKKGYRFQTNSDTEVLLQLYLEKGENMLQDLRGMFAFAIWDGRKKALFLARDPYGIKPLYYSDDGWTVRIASQVKALHAGGRISKDIEPAGLVGFCLLGSVPEPHTLYRQIRLLPAGSFCWINEYGLKKPVQYFSLAKVYCDAEENAYTSSPEENKNLMRACLQESMRSHLVSDVPVGLFLSAGLDSATLAGLAKDMGHGNIKTITLSFREFEGSQEDESLLAEEIARHYQTSHTTRVVTFEEFKQDWPLILENMDQPSIDGINTWFVSKAAHEAGLKVALSGVGGDELLRGYSSFQKIPYYVRSLGLFSRIPFLNISFQKCMEMLMLLGLQVHPKTKAIFNKTGSYKGAYLLQRGLFLSSELKKLLDIEFVKMGLERLQLFKHIQSRLNPMPKNNFSKVSVLESSLYMRNQLLRDTDWSSMAHSVEVRTPLVDSSLVKQLAPLLSRNTQSVKKDFLEKVPLLELPQKIKNRKKSGFVIPLERWIRQLKLEEEVGEGYPVNSRYFAKYLLKTIA